MFFKKKGVCVLSKVKFGDIVKDVKLSVDRNNNPYDYFIAGEHMDSENLKITRRGKFSNSDVGPAFHRIFKPGQILYGSRRTYLKKVAVADFEGITSNTTFVLESKDESKFLQRFLPFVMLSDKFTDYSIKNSKGSTNPYILFSDLAKFEFDLPSLDDQKRLTELFWAANDTKEAYKKLLFLTDDLIKSQFIEMFGDPHKNPHNWEVASVEEWVKRGFIERPMDGNHGEKHPKASDYVPTGVPFIMANNLIDGQVDYSSCSYLSEHQANSLDKGFARTGDVLITHKGTIGRTAIVDNKFKFIMLTPQVTYYRTLKGLNNKYLKEYFNSDYFQTEMFNIAGNGTTRAYIGITAQKKLPIVVPPIDLQGEFAEFVEHCDKSKFHLKKTISNLDNTVKSLMRRYIR
jgi:type I restriction enzyme, S subunit